VTEAVLDADRLLHRLEALAATAPSSGPPGATGTGVTRLAWSAEDMVARALVTGWLAEVGVETATDAAGNLTAEWPGTSTGLAPLVSGSHLDTVIEGGALDGAYGVVAAAGEHLRHPVRAVAWANEEGVVAPPFTGSRTASGRGVDPTAAGPGGTTLAEHLRSTGGDPEGLVAAAWAPVAAYLELHIEQGPVLDATTCPIGVVTGIIGNLRGTVTVVGKANHAGTTPMDRRCDALAAAAPIVALVRDLAVDGPADVATVGALEVHPGNVNVVPGRVTLTYDIRSLDDDRSEAALALLRNGLSGIAAASGATVTLSPTFSSAAVPTDPRLRTVVREAASGLGLATADLPSGAGHDAQHVANLGPMGMIFVPSIAGISHNPAEATAPDDLVAGARTLLAALRLADARIDP
jgi:hydantoinase/carbamoylase family amidase